MKHIRIKTKDRRHVVALGQALAGIARVSLESQQLQAVGAMPKANLTVIDPRSLKNAELARLVAEGEETTNKELVLVENADETVAERADREELELVLEEAGFTVFHTTDEYADYAKKHPEMLPEDDAVTAIPVMLTEIKTEVMEPH